MENSVKAANEAAAREKKGNRDGNEEEPAIMRLAQSQNAIHDPEDEEQVKKWREEGKLVIPV